jgi:hypothetical protein
MFAPIYHRNPVQPDPPSHRFDIHGLTLPHWKIFEKKNFVSHEHGHIFSCLYSQNTTARQPFTEHAY